MVWEATYKSHHISSTLTCPQPIPQDTTPITFQIPLRSQTNGPPPSPLQASLPSSPPAHKKPGLTSRLLRLLFSSVPSELEFSPGCDCVGISGRVTFAAASSLNASISLPKLRGSIEPSPRLEGLLMFCDIRPPWEALLKPPV
uniref:Uncharacterized protein n=1 Tax=Glossina palpalis gambiensis TaxID=67801 RepID=A0A1B0BY27_9MUSC